MNDMVKLYAAGGTLTYTFKNQNSNRMTRLQKKKLKKLGLKAAVPIGNIPDGGLRAGETILLRYDPETNSMQVIDP